MRGKTIMTEHVNMHIFDLQNMTTRVDFWIFCAFFLMCVFLYLVIWPLIRASLTEQIKHLQQTFIAFTARTTDANHQKNLSSEKHAAAMAYIKDCEEETHQMIDRMRITHAEQRETWKKHMIQSMNLTIEGEKRTRAHAQADMLIDRIINDVSKDTAEMKSFRQNYTKTIITNCQSESTQKK